MANCLLNKSTTFTRSISKWPYLLLFPLMLLFATKGQAQYCNFAVYNSGTLYGYDNQSGNNFWITNMSVTGSGVTSSTPFSGGTTDRATPSAGYNQGTFTSYGATVMQGFAPIFSIAKTTTASTNACYIRIYVDWGNNNQFTDPEDLIASSGSIAGGSPGTYTISSYTIPTSTSTSANTVGAHRMRVVCEWTGETQQGSCGLSGAAGAQGDAKDFTLTVAAAPACSGSPGSFAVSPSTASICNAASTSISVAFDATGYTYQWQQSSSSGGPFVNAVGGSGATTSTYTTPSGSALPYATTYYACQVTCTASGQTTLSQVSAVSKNSFLNCYCTSGIYTTANNANRGILNVTLTGNTTNINNTTTVNTVSPYYTLYSTPIADLTQGTLYNGSVKTGAQTGAVHFVSVFIDYDQDGTFGGYNSAGTATSGGDYSVGGSATGYLERVAQFGATGANITTPFSFTVPATAPGGTTAMRVFYKNASTTAGQNPCSTSGAGETEDYRVAMPANMTYQSSTTTQNSVSVQPNTTNQQIVGLQVVVAGNLTPLSVSSITFNTSGSTAALSDITNARIFYTGTSSTFATTTQFGSTQVSPNGTITVTPGSATTLSNGTNYFWLAYDIAPGAAVGDFASGAITSFVISSSTKTPASTATANRLINPSYCQPVASNCAGFGYISNVTLNTINNTSGTANCGTTIQGLSDFASSISPTVLYSPSTGNSFSVTRGSDGSTLYWLAIYMDINNDGDFADGGELLFADYPAGATNTGSSAATITNTIDIPSGVSPGNHRLRIRNIRANNGTTVTTDAIDPCATANYGEAEDYLITVQSAVSPMTYVSSNVSQVTGTVAVASANNAIVQIQVVTQNAASPLSATAFDFNASTAAVSTNLADITNAKIYYTGTSSTFSTTNLFGTKSSITSGTNTITGSQSLAAGNNYFWLTYDVPSYAGVGDLIDAKVTKVVMSDGNHTDQATQDPTGSRTIGSFTYCVPSSTNNCTTFGSIINSSITGLSPSSLNNSSSCATTSTGYSDFTASVAPVSLQTPSTNNFTITRATGDGSAYYVAIWVDLDNNGTYDSPSELLYNTPGGSPVSSATPISGSISIPSGTVTGLHRMRIRNIYNTASSFDPCITYAYGEAEDYMVNIVDPCAGAPTNATGISVTSNGAGDQATISYNRGSGNKVLIVARQGGQVTQGPVNGVDYSAGASSVYGTGSAQIAATGNYVVYNGTAASTTVTGLTPGATYYFSVYEYNTATFCYASVPLRGSVVANNPMSITSSTTTQVTGNTNPSATNVAILQIQVVTTGGLTPAMTATSLNIKTNGSTNAATDISNIKIYYTGTSSTFGTSTQFGSTLTGGSIPTGTTAATVTGSQTLAVGTNYFWVAYDISSTATPNDVVDAECSQVIVNSTFSGNFSSTPTVQAPSGNRAIVLTYCTPSAGANQAGHSIRGVSYTGTGSTFSWTGSSTNSYVDNSSYVGNVTSGNTYNLNVTRGTDGFAENSYVYVWVDWNNSGGFADGSNNPQEYIMQGQLVASGVVATVSVTIPAGASAGNHRMRVWTAYSGNAGGPGANACATLGSGANNGQAMDFTVNVLACASPPVVNITPGGATTFCAGGSVTLTASGATTYAWSPSTGLSNAAIANPVATPPTTTTYTVTGTTSGCTGTAQITVNVNPTTISFSPSSPTINVGNSVSVTASTTSTNAGTITYAWGPSVGLNTTTGATVTANPLSTSTYTVTATDGIGCSTTGNVIVLVNSGTPGQVSCGYTFSKSTGSSVALLSGATVLASGVNSTTDDAIYPNQSIGFNFDYNGITYNTLGVSTNGFVWFGSTNPSTTEYNPISTSTGLEGAISVMGANIKGALTTGGCAGYTSSAIGDGTTSLSIKTSGTAPNRTFTVQWHSFESAVSGTNNNCSLGDYQIILSENGNGISFRYNNYAYFINDIFTGQVGLRGATNTDFNNRRVDCTNNWDRPSTSSAAGTVNTDICTIDGASCNLYPEQTLVWSWTPNIATPTITPNGQQNLCLGGSGVTLTANTTMSSPTYKWQTYTYPPSNTDISPAQTASTYLANPSTVGNYFYVVKVTNGAGCSRTSYAEAVVVSATPVITSHSTNNPSSCVATDGNIVLPGFTASTIYSVSYTKNAVPVAAANITSDGSGVITLPALGVGTYNNIVVTLNSCSSTAYPASGVITLSCGPTAYDLSGGPYCGTGTITLSNSENGATYQLKNGVTNVGSAQNGSTGNPINFTPPTNTGSTDITYTVVGTNAQGSTTMNNSVLVHPIPVISSNNLTNPTTCGGSNGSIKLNGLTNGTSYTINYNFNGTPQTQVTQTASAGSVTLSGLVAGNYNNIVVAYASTGCGTAAYPSSGNLTLSDPTPPAAPTSGGNVAVCETAVPASITASTPAGNVIDWYSASTSGTLLLSNSSTYSNLNTTGTYYASARSLSTGCASATRTPVTLTVNANPTPFTVLGGACTPANIGLNGSQTGVNYRAWRDGSTAVGSNVPGTGGVIYFGTFNTTGIYSVIATNPTTGCTANMVGVSTVGVCLSTWVGGTTVSGTDWFQPVNWNPQAVPNVCGSTVVIPANAVSYPVIAGNNVQVGNMNIDAGANITVDTNVVLNVCGDWTSGTGPGSAIIGRGKVILNGGFNQTLTGTTTFNVLELDNNTGASLATGSTVSIRRGVHLHTGDLNVTAGTLHLLSTSASTNSYIDDFNQSPQYTGTITGSVTIDRYVPVRGSNQHFISSPVKSASLSQINASGPDGQYVLPTNDCDERASAIRSPYGTVFVYNDGYRPNGYCMLGNWMIKSVGSMDNGRGYSTYLDGNTTLSLIGEINTGTVQVNNLNNSGYNSVVTKQGQTIESGWNLVGNPYPSALNMTVPRTGDGFQNQVQIWNTSGPFSGSWQPGVIGTDAVVIAPFQAFMVRVSPGSVGTHSYSFTQAERTRSTNVPFYRTASENTLQLEVDYNGAKDVTRVSFNPSATIGFDDEYDANKTNGAAGRPTLYTTVNTGTWFAINNVPSLTETTTIPVGLRPEADGVMVLSPKGIESFDPTTYILLEDKKTGVWHNLRDGAYTFNTTKDDAQNRFVLHFTPPAKILTSDANCESSGQITVEQPGNASWNYKLVDAANNTVANGVVNQNSPISVSAVTGTYTLTLTDNVGYTVTKSIQIAGLQKITAAFTQSTTSALTQEDITFNSTSDAATTINWDFGDGARATGQTTAHSYASEGVYIVSLTVTSVEGCSSTTSRTVTITSRSSEPTGINDITSKGLHIWSNDNRVFVDFTKQGKVEAEIDIYNVIGQLINHEKFGKSGIYSKEIPNTEAAYVIIKVKNGDAVETRKLFIANTK